MYIETNIDFEHFDDALRTNFIGVSNKDYIKDSIDYHEKEHWITHEQAKKLREEYL